MKDSWIDYYFFNVENSLRFCIVAWLVFIDDFGLYRRCKRLDRVNSGKVVYVKLAYKTLPPSRINRSILTDMDFGA